MLFSDLSPHVKFLNDAAHLLSHSAPEASAFLISRRNELLVENDVPISDAQRQHACSACGHIMIPGQGDTLTIVTDKAPQPKSKKPSRAQQASAASAPPPLPSLARASPGGISKVMTCGSCSRKTRLTLEGPRRISRARQTTLDGRAAGEKKPWQVTAEPSKSSANANSKKRAKNRKAGLQALLDQKKASAPSSGFGLSLSDFMKK